MEAPRHATTGRGQRIVRAGMAVAVVANVILGEAHTKAFGIREELKEAREARVSNEPL